MRILNRLIRRHEGSRRRPYRDSRGILTVGIGRNLDAVPFRDDEIMLMFDNDVADATRQVERLFRETWTNLSAVRKAVLVDMMFNMGAPTLTGFKKMRRAVRVGDFEEAAAQMLDSRWATQVGRKPNQRAWRLATMMRSDAWPTDCEER